MAATGGTGSVGCAALGGFVGGLVGSMVTNSLDADEESFGQFVGEALFDGAIGAVMGGVGALVGAAAFGAGVALTAGMGIRAGGQMAGAGIRSAVTGSARAGMGGSGSSGLLTRANSLRPVGEVLESVNDVMANPQLLKGMSPAQVEAIIGRTPGWQIEKLGQGSRAGRGWVFRQYNSRGNPTGPQIRWHPGGGHHGPDPYWRVVGPNGDLGGVIFQ